METTVQLRPGAVDKGRIYEQKMAALFATKLSLDTTVEDFWMVSNIEDVGDFDDLVISVRHSDGTSILYVIQFKHIQKETLQFQLLESVKSDFSMRKYQRSFDLLKEKIGKGIFDKHSIENTFLILHTNAKLVGNGKRLNYTQEIKELGFLNTSSQPNAIYRIENANKEDTFLDNNFLSKFMLCTNQANATRLDDLIKSCISSYCKAFQNNSVFSITHFFTLWSIGRHNKITTLPKRYVQTHLLELILLPYIVDPQTNKKIENNSVDLIQKTLLCFNGIFVHQDRSVQNILCSIKSVLEELCGFNFDIADWNTHLSNKELDQIFSRSFGENQIWKILKRRSQYYPAITFRDIYVSAWQCKLVPLVLNCHLAQDTIRDSLRLFDNITKDLSFVLLRPNFDIADNEFKIFRNVTDIEDAYLQNENLSNMSISLQGKSAILLSDIENNSKIIRRINPDLYLALLEEPLDLGIRIDIEDYYIEQRIHSPAIRMEVLESLGDQNTNLFVLFQVTSVLKYNISTSLKSYLDKTEKHDNISILISEEADVPKLMNAVDHLRNSTGKAVHLLKFIDESILAWIYSAGPIDSLQSFIVEEEEVSKESEVHVDNMLVSTLNILSGNAGMGKTMFLKNITQKYQQNTWVCFIHLIEHRQEMSKICNMAEVIEYLLKVQMGKETNYYQEFCESVFSNRMDNGNMVWIFDGYDELISDDAINFLKAAASSKLAKIWITTRPLYKSYLEREFQTIANEIFGFTKQDCLSFLHKYFHSICDAFNFDKDSILCSMETYLETVESILTKVPLYVKMLAKVFADDMEKLKDKASMSVAQLYDAYIDIELRQYKNYDAKNIREILSKLALKSYNLPEDVEGMLDDYVVIETIPEMDQDNATLALIRENGTVTFVHQTFAEYLAADLITKNMYNSNQYNQEECLKVTGNLTSNELQPIKIFMDRIIKDILPLSELKKTERVLREKRDDVVENYKAIENTVREARDEVVDLGKRVEKSIKSARKLKKNI